MVEGYHEFTKSGKMKRASYEEVYNCIDKSWSEITTECIKNGFIKSNVNYYGSTEETILMDTDSDSSDTEIPDELIDALDSFDINSEDDFNGFD